MDDPVVHRGIQDKPFSRASQHARTPDPSTHATLKTGSCCDGIMCRCGWTLFVGRWRAVFNLFEILSLSLREDSVIPFSATFLISGHWARGLSRGQLENDCAGCHRIEKAPGATRRDFCHADHPCVKGMILQDWIPPSLWIAGYSMVHSQPCAQIYSAWTCSCYSVLSIFPTTMAKKKVMVDVISDVVWPFCWIGKRNLEGAMQQTLGRTIVIWTCGARRFVDDLNVLMQSIQPDIQLARVWYINFHGYQFNCKSTFIELYCTSMRD